MNPRSHIENARLFADKLSANVKDRYNKRAQSRDAKLKEVEERGVLRAAGIEAAVGRAAHLTVVEGRNFEAIIGGNDLDDINFLPRGTKAARSTCRLTVQGVPIGTGFLIAPGLLLTNNHVIGSRVDAADFTAEFDFELDEFGDPKSPSRFRLDPDKLYVGSKALDLDFSIVAVAETGETGESIRSFGWLPLDGRTNKILEGEPIVIVQHPQGRMKQICIFHGELVDRLDGTYLHYTTDSEPGSSGSPAFNRSWQVVGLHHASVPAGTRRRGQPTMLNEAVRASVIVQALQRGEKLLAEDGDLHLADAQKAYSRISNPATMGDGRPQGPRTLCVGSPTPAPATIPELERTTIRTHDAAHFQGRGGYQSDFLGAGFAVPLPALPPWMEQETAKLLDDPQKYVLDYTHFSCVISASRKLPLLTACNIDGKLSRSLSRKDRNPDAGPESMIPGVAELEAADVWFFDGRISRGLQLGPDVYDKTAFDFGHMVRREDPVWDDLRTARIANDDTFHMSNCAPQHHDLNTKTWLELENGVLRTARERKMRVSVFTGPVLSTRDPVVLGVKVPTGFWKIVAWVENGRLKARGFMQWQKELVDRIIDSLERATPLDRVEEYQVRIRDIARETALDFGPLLAADDPPRGGGRQIDESLGNDPMGG
jgi:endonuclease G